MPKNNKTQDPLGPVLNENIPLTAVQRERIGYVISKDIERAINDNKANFSTAIRCDDQYEGKTKTKNFPWKGASNLWIPLSEWTADAMYARIMAACFSKVPYVKAEGRNKESIENQEAATELLDYVFSSNVMNLQEKCKTIFKEAIKKPKSTCKLTWQIIKDNWRKLEKGLRFLIEGKEKVVTLEEAEKRIKEGEQPISLEPAKAVTNEPYEIYNGPVLEYLPYVYYVTPINSVLGQKPRFEAHLAPMRWNDIVRGLENGDFYPDEVRKLKTAAELVSGATTSEEDIRSKELKGRDYLFDYAEYHGVYAFEQEAEEGEERREKVEVEVVFGVELKNKVLLMARYPMLRPKLKRRVFYNTRFETLGNRFEGRGILQKLENLNKALNMYYNHLINNAMMVMTKIFKRKRAAGDLNVDDPEIYPGCIVDVKEMTDFEAIDMGDIKAIGVDILGMVLKFAERLTSVTPWGLGTQPGKTEGRGKVTATEFTGIMGEASLNFNIITKNFVSTLEAICEDTLELYYYNMPEGFERRIRGEKGRFVFPEKEAERVWNREAFKGQFNFHWQITDDRGRVIERDIFILNNFIDLPFMGRYIKKTWEMAKSVAISLGKRDWETVLPTEEEIDLEQRKIDQNAEAERLILMRQMLMKKGYSAEEIDSAMKRTGIGA